MTERHVTVLAWLIIGITLLAETIDLFAEDPNGPGSGIGPLAVVAAGWLFGRRIANGVTMSNGTGHQ